MLNIPLNFTIISQHNSNKPRETFSLKFMRNFYLLYYHMLFTFSSQLTTTDRSRPSQTPFLIDLLSTFNMSSTTKTVDLNISAKTISNVHARSKNSIRLGLPFF